MKRAHINGLELEYEGHGTGKPLLPVHLVTLAAAAFLGAAGCGAEAGPDIEGVGCIGQASTAYNSTTYNGRVINGAPCRESRSTAASPAARPAPRSS